MSQYLYLKQQIAPLCQMGLLLSQDNIELITLHEAVDSMQIGAIWLQEAANASREEDTITQDAESDPEQVPEQALLLSPKILCENLDRDLRLIANQIPLLLEDPYINETTRTALSAAYIRLKESAMKYKFVALYYERLENNRGLGPQYN